ncbi:hypothetical protein ABQE44_25370 [Mycolicibacterium sp. XJ2546]
MMNDPMELSETTADANPDTDAVPDTDVSLARIANSLHELTIAEWAAVRVLDERLKQVVDRLGVIAERV